MFIGANDYFDHHEWYAIMHRRLILWKLGAYGIKLCVLDVMQHLTPIIIGFNDFISGKKMVLFVELVNDGIRVIILFVYVDFICCKC